MSENLDLVRSIYSAWERGERSRIDWAHPQIEFVVADGPAPGRWTGVDGMAEGFRDLLSAWDEWRPQADEFREVDDERIVVLDHTSGRGKRSGLELGQMRTDGAAVFHLRGGKVTKALIYWDRGRALADLGLKE